MCIREDARNDERVVVSGRVKAADELYAGRGGGNARKGE